MRRRPRIAVLEADDLIRELILRCLDESGLVASAVPSAGFQPKGYALVIADAPSVERATVLAADLRRSGARAVLLTSARFPPEASGSHELAQRIGADAVLSKPFTPELLLAAVRAVIRPAR